MWLSCLLLVLGLALVVGGAEFLVSGASGIARKAGISEFVIGLTIVGMGTSAPEMVVSLVGAIEGNADIAVGNVLGSNIFNSMFILGITAVLAPMAITRTNRRTDIPVNILVTFLLLALGLKQTLFSLGTDELGRIEGAALLALFVGYMVMSFVKGKGQQQEAAPGEKPVNTWLSILMAIGGIAALIIGGRFFVNSAVDLAKALGVSDKFIAITLLAGGTSLPELATCVVAAARKKGQLALGNIIGSNIFNILLILGGSAIITPLSFADINLVDAGALMLSALLIFTSAFIGRKNEIDRVDGALMLAAGIAYYTWLFIRL